MELLRGYAGYDVSCLRTARVHWSLSTGLLNSQQDLQAILTDSGLAQLGDALLNFTLSMALTEMTGRPTGTRVLDKTLAEAAVKAGLREYLPRRVNRGDVANSIEALLGFVWMKKLITLDEVVACLKAETASPSMNFAQLAGLALTRMKK